MNGFFSTIATNAGGSVEKKVVPCISWRDRTVIEKSDVADPWEHEIFQNGSCSGTGTNDQNARRFQSRLSRLSPESGTAVSVSGRPEYRPRTISTPKSTIISTGLIVRLDSSSRRACV